MKKRLIEHNIPLAEISEESAREKNIRHGHPSTLHIWWARRPLAASRATAFAALIDDPGPDEPAPEGSGFETKREYLQDLIKRITPWEAVKDGNSEAIEEAQQLIAEQYGQAPKVLDPFAGGGSIPLEALRLGCETYASDYNPVAVFIEKATLEWPQKFGIEVELPKELVHGSTRMNTDEKSKEKSVKSVQSVVQKKIWDEGETEKVNLLAYLVEKWANIILEEARAEIGQFYPHESSDGLIGFREIKHQDGWIPVGYLWARTIPCQNPGCGAEIPLIKQFWLAKKKNKKIAYRPVVDYENKRVDFEILENAAAIEAANFDPSEGTVSRANARCLVCEQITKAKQVRQLAQDGKMGERMVAAVLRNPSQFGKGYRTANECDKHIYSKAKKYLLRKIKSWQYLETPLPSEKLPEIGTLGFSVQRYGMEHWEDIYNSRQKLALLTFIEKILEKTTQIQDDCYVFLTGAKLSKNQEEFSHAILGYLGLILSKMSDFSSSICLLNYTGGRGVKNAFGRGALPITWDYIESNIFNDAGASWPANLNGIVKAIKTLHFTSRATGYVKPG
nr:DUF1156 domain-containing protein [Chloroflexota bacterium]